MKQHIIYIPGLGDKYDVARRLGLLLWRRSDIAVTHVPMNWRDPSETFEDKLARLERAISRYPDRITTLVGESAGGPVAIVALQRFSDQVSRIVTVCGMNQGAGSVNPRLYQKNRAFREAMEQADMITPRLTAEKKASMTTIYSSGDPTVRPKHTLFSGVEAYDLRIPGHMTSILAVLFYRYRLITERR